MCLYIRRLFLLTCRLRRPSAATCVTRDASLIERKKTNRINLPPVEVREEMEAAMMLEGVLIGRVNTEIRVEEKRNQFHLLRIQKAIKTSISSPRVHDGSYRLTSLRVNKDYMSVDNQEVVSLRLNRTV